MAVRRLYEPLCIAFGTTVSSPTVPTYQLYDLPHKFTPRLYMESEDPNLVLREIGVWAGWEQAGSANTRSFLLDLLKDEDAHDNFLVREAGCPLCLSLSHPTSAVSCCRLHTRDLHHTAGGALPSA